MTDWGLALSALGTIAALGMLVRASIRDLSDHLDRRFAEAESRRAEASASWGARLADRDRTIERLAFDLREAVGEHRGIYETIDAVRLMVETERRTVADNYVTRETFLEATGAIRVTLEKLSERLAQLSRLSQRLSELEPPATAQAHGLQDHPT